MGTIIDISLNIVLIIWAVISILTIKQKYEQIDDLKKELDIKDHAMIAAMEGEKKFYEQHFNQFVKHNKDITLEQFIEKYSDELAHIMVYVPKTKTTREIITELKNELKKKEIKNKPWKTK